MTHIIVIALDASRVRSRVHFPEELIMLPFVPLHYEWCSAAPRRPNNLASPGPSVDAQYRRVNCACLYNARRI